MKSAAQMIVVLLCVVLTPCVYAQVPGIEPEHPYSFGGYVKILTQAGIPDTGDTTWDHFTHLRLNFEYRWSEALSFNAGMRNRLFWGDSLDVPGFGELLAEDPGYVDLSSNWLEGDDALGNTAFDRFHLNWQHRAWEMRVGRQRINWGMATLWNPNDLFNVYSIFDFDYEERPGTDAVLISHSPGYASRAEAVWEFGDDWDEVSLAGRYRLNLSGFDIQILGGKKKTDLVVGAGFSGSLWGAGISGEVSHFDPYKNESDGIEQEPSTVSTLETDYHLPGKGNLAWKVSILHTSNPQDPDSMRVYLSKPLTAKTISFSRWTAYGEAAFDITALSRQAIGIAVYDDESWYATATNFYSLADDWQLRLVWQHYDGPSGSFFGEDPSDILSGSLRWSF
jgi:hypothetical protein